MKLSHVPILYISTHVTSIILSIMKLLGYFYDWSWLIILFPFVLDIVVILIFVFAVIVMIALSNLFS